MKIVVTNYDKMKFKIIGNCKIGMQVALIFDKFFSIDIFPLIFFAIKNVENGYKFDI